MRDTSSIPALHLVLNLCSFLKKDVEIHKHKYDEKDDKETQQEEEEKEEHVPEEGTL